MTVGEPLIAHHVLEFPGGFTRSVGPVVGRFLAGLRDGRFEAVRTASGRVIVPPTEYDPETSAPLGDDWVEVGPAGRVESWTWVAQPREGKHPLTRPFAFALVRLDGADTSMLHAVDAGSPDAIAVGMRVRPRWHAARSGYITDLECFEPMTDGEQPVPAPPNANAEATDEPIERIKVPIRLDYDIAAGTAPAVFLRGLAEHKLIGQRARNSADVYVPPRGADPKNGVPTEVDVEVGPQGTVTTFCVVDVKFTELTPEVPYVCAQVLLDGAHIAFFGLIAEIPAREVREGLRVEAVWADASIADQRAIKWFRPTGEPDAPYDSYKDYV